MAHDAQHIAGMSVDTSQERQALQQALFESAGQLVEDARRFTGDWHRRWSGTPSERQIDALSAELAGYLEGLYQEFGRVDGPEPPQVSPLLGALLGTQDVPGPLARIQALTGNDPEALSLEAQRLLGEVDALFIQLNGLRGQWQEYLSLLSAPEPEVTRHPTQPFLPQEAQEDEQPAPAALLELPPLPMKQPRRPSSAAAPAAPPFLGEREDWLPRLTASLVMDNLKPPPSPTSVSENTGQGMNSTLRVMLVLGVALMLIVFGAYEVVSHLPISGDQASYQPGTPQSGITATTAPGPTSTPLPIITTAPQPTATSPIVNPTTPPAAGSSELSVNPQVLLVPCPGNGAATLQLVDSGSRSLDWTATPSGAEILLDGAASVSGHLNPGDVALVSVTSQVQVAQGTIMITTAGGSSPISVSYQVSC